MIKILYDNTLGGGIMAEKKLKKHNVEGLAKRTFQIHYTTATTTYAQNESAQNTTLTTATATTTPNTSTQSTTTTTTMTTVSSNQNTITPTTGNPHRNKVSKKSIRNKRRRNFWKINKNISSLKQSHNKKSQNAPL